MSAEDDDTPRKGDPAPADGQASTDGRASKPRPSTEQDDRVGYGKPPRHTRFQPGRSGNPRGRPRSSKNLKTVAKQVLQQPVVVIERGRRKTVSALEAVLQKLLGRALKDGDTRAVASVLALAERAGLADEAAPEAAGLTAAEREIVETLKARLLGSVSAGSPDGDAP